MNNKVKICPFMSSKMNYQYCIDECNFYDQYVGCLIKFHLQEIHNDTSNIGTIVQDIRLKDND